jgi:aminoglycoside/choline kinase family phosphotransferase
VTSRPPPSKLLSWAQSVVGSAEQEPEPGLSGVAGDASNRRYFRTSLGGTPHIVVEAPPATEKNPAFLAVREILARAGVKVPAVYGADLERGYLLLEDLGDRLLLAELNDASVTGWYADAMGILGRIAALNTADLELPVYDASLLGEELGRFPQWFAGALLHCGLDEDEQALLDSVFTLLMDSALEQPRVLVHRDFHSRNLMPQADGQLAVIDFQDAVLGPVSYDLVSLLRDCYVRWPEERVRGWALDHLRQLQARGLAPDVDGARFLRWFDLMGLQRHIKVLGTFARLYLRDDKPAYLDDLPLVIRYVREVSARYAVEEPLLGAFHRWFENRLAPLISARLGSARS